MCMMAVGLIGGLMGGVMQAMGAMQAANAQAASAKAQAKGLAREGHYAVTKSAWDSQRSVERGLVMAGEATSAYSATGIDAATGSPGQKIAFGILEPAVLEGGIQQFEGRHKANQLFYSAEQKKMEAKAAKQAGMIGALTPIVGAFGNMFGGLR